jgi:4-hydroxybenzoate polyprenyl transferase
MQLIEYLKLLRLHQPTGIFLLLWPCLWGVALANDISNINLIFLMTVGSITMRSAGCIINDIIDIEIDKKVERTKNRPLAKGVVTIREAVLLLVFLLSIALIIFTYLNILAKIIALISLILVISYPFMKRITYWPQLFLGFTFNIGVLIGYGQASTNIDLAAILLYIAGIFWTLGYDTIYGYQDIKDDLIIGVKSSAIAMRKQPKFILFLIYILMMICILISLYLKNAGNLAYISLIFPGVILLWQALTLQINNVNNCLERFKSNIYVGLMIFGTISISFIHY